ncbi:MAG: glycoside hydrolase family 3 C-terminal domain-containing protein [Propionibacteriaceae bacterium]|jgi:beta-glucosidase|nr:glycoside hydrolase family 3 C-terminal domain-containing protein [Propionibacteriaceae bacterium]
MITTYPYQDSALPIDQRVSDLMSRLSLEDKAGLMFHTMVGYGDITHKEPMFGLPSLTSMVTKRRMSHFNVIGSLASGREMAAWHNRAQDLAATTGWGIPLSISTDPRHGFTDNPGAAMLAGPFSQWPEPLGLAALRDPDAVRVFADTARQEYIAVGIRVALHPQIDVATEPRWARCNGTFGEDADLVALLGQAYIEGYQTDDFGSESVSTMAKHFPGGGPQKDGEDPHFPYGKDQVYPSGSFDYHLKPFLTAIAAGVRQMMPYYGRPVGTEWEEVGFGFNKGILTDLLRDKLGFTGIVCTDWGLLTDTDMDGQDFPARAWGVEHLTREERMLKGIDAGVDQFGGELCPDVLVGLVRDGKVTESRLDTSVRRLLVEKYTLGLFDSRHVDEERALMVVGSDEFIEAGLRAQSQSVTVLKNDQTAARLPQATGVKVYVEGMNPATLSGRATVVDSPDQADLAILRLKAPFEPRGSGFDAFFHAGSLDFPQAQVDHVKAIADLAPTIVDVYLDRPAILTPMVPLANTLTVTYGTSDAAYADVVFGVVTPSGKLPFDLPRSMAAVEASPEDAPFATADPLFHFGDGLSV